MTIKWRTAKMNYLIDQQKQWKIEMKDILKLKWKMKFSLNIQIRTDLFKILANFDSILKNYDKSIHRFEIADANQLPTKKCESFKFSKFR
jgi:hypothetical protein